MIHKIPRKTNYQYLIKTLVQILHGSHKICLGRLIEKFGFLGSNLERYIRIYIMKAVFFILYKVCKISTIFLKNTIKKQAKNDNYIQKTSKKIEYTRANMKHNSTKTLTWKYKKTVNKIMWSTFLK